MAGWTRYCEFPFAPMQAKICDNHLVYDNEELKWIITYQVKVEIYFFLVI